MTSDADCWPENTLTVPSSCSFKTLSRLQNSAFLKILIEGKPPLTAWSMVGDGSIGSPSLHSARSSFRRAACRPASAWSRPWPHLGRLRGENIGHRARLAELPVQSFAVSAGTGAWGDISEPSGHPTRTLRTGGAGDYSKDGQHPSSSWRPVRCWQVPSSSRCPTSFQTAWGPASRTASAFWISTVRPQRRQATRSSCR
jgi:hypothetical protein